MAILAKAKKAGKKALKKTKIGKAILGNTKRRKKGPIYWQNKVLVEKLKRKYNKLKFGGR